MSEEPKQEGQEGGEGRGGEGRGGEGRGGEGRGGEGRGGEGRGVGRGGGRGRGRGRGGRGGRDGGGKGKFRGKGPQEEEWKPVTNLGRLVKAGIIKNIDLIYYNSIPIKEHQIVDLLVKEAKEQSGAKDGKELKEEILKVKSVQKQTKAGQRTRLKVVMAVGDGDGHLGVGTKVHKDMQNAMKGSLIIAKLNLIPVRRGYWGSYIGNPHTVPMKVTGKCGSVRMRLIPAPRGTGIVGAPATKKLMAFCGVYDCFTQSQGNTDTMENFLRAVFQALYKTYCFLTPDLWKNRSLQQELFSQYHNELKEQQKQDKQDK